MYYYYTDHLDSTRLVTNENKNIVTAVTSYPFGEPDIEQGSEDYLFCRKQKDATIYYYGACYYDPDPGRFITRDPLKGAIKSSNVEYAYCFNNPLKYVGLLDCQQCFQTKKLKKHMKSKLQKKRSVKEKGYPVTHYSEYELVVRGRVKQGGNGSL